MEKRLKSKGIIPTKQGFGEGVKEIAKYRKEVIGLGADITASTGMNLFADAFPERFFSIGIAEQNCVGMAAGLALEGFIPIFTSYAAFSALRTTDHIRILLCYNNLHVIIGGAHSGISVGPDGATHQALEDIAVLNSLPNITIFSPCDSTQTKQVVSEAINNCQGPVYIRFGRNPVPDFTEVEPPLIKGKGQILADGEDACIIATGHMVWEALQASYTLKKAGIGCRVVNIHTIKPFDDEIIAECASKYRFFVTAEEHQTTGGLGSVVASSVTKLNKPVKVIRTGMDDRFGESGEPAELMDKYNLNSKYLIKTIQQNIK